MPLACFRQGETRLLVVGLLYQSLNNEYRRERILGGVDSLSLEWLVDELIWYKHEGVEYHRIYITGLEELHLNWYNLYRVHIRVKDPAEPTYNHEAHVRLLRSVTSECRYQNRCLTLRKELQTPRELKALIAYWEATVEALPELERNRIRRRRSSPTSSLNSTESSVPCFHGRMGR
jgi:hypothetical protein